MLPGAMHSGSHRPPFVDATQRRPNGRVTPALQNANDLINDADRVVDANDTVFGTTGGPVSVIVFAMDGNTDGTGADTRAELPNEAQTSMAAPVV
jgi:hypothetical protein